MVTEASRIVATCGSVNVDVTAFCERIPRLGETVAGERYTIGLGGKGANQAAAVAKLGLRSVIIGRTGTDAFATLARGRLAELGVELDHLPGDDHKVGALLGAGAQRRRRVGVGLDDGGLAERRRQPGKNFEIGGAVIDNDHQLGCQNALPRRD